MDDWVKRAVGSAYRPTCCICGCDIHMGSFGAAKKNGRGAVFWHDRCYQERYGKTPGQYEEMKRAELQTELDPEQQADLDRLRKGKGMKTESVYAVVFENGKCWRERRDGYPTKAEGLFICKTGHVKVKGKSAAWEAIDAKSGLRLIGPFGTKKECEGALTDEVVGRLLKYRANSAWRAAVRMSELVWARGSMKTEEYNRLSKQYKAEELEKFKQQREEEKAKEAPKKEEEHMEDTKLNGEHVCITGTLPTMTRSEAFARLKAVGGVPCERFNKKVTLFVIADKAGRDKRKKAEAAIANGQELRVIDGGEFTEALKAAEAEQTARAVEMAAKRKAGANVKATVKKDDGVTAIVMEPEKKEDMHMIDELKKELEELKDELKSARKELDTVWKENASLKAKKEVPPAPKAPKVEETAAAVSLETMRKWCEGKGLVATQKREGTCIWVEGDSKAYKDELVEMGFRFAKKRKSWYLNPAA